MVSQISQIILGAGVSGPTIRSGRLFGPDSHNTGSSADYSAHLCNLNARVKPTGLFTRQEPALDGNQLIRAGAEAQ